MVKSRVDAGLDPEREGRCWETAEPQAPPGAQLVAVHQWRPHRRSCGGHWEGSPRGCLCTLSTNLKPSQNQRSFKVYLQEGYQGEGVPWTGGPAWELSQSGNRDPPKNGELWEQAGRWSYGQVPVGVEQLHKYLKEHGGTVSYSQRMELPEPQEKIRMSPEC